MAQSSIDYSKAFTWLLTITLGFIAWFGKVSYDKLNSIDDKVQTLLVQNGVQNAEIQNLKERIKGKQGNNNNEKSSPIVYQEGILPNQVTRKKFTFLPERY